MHLATLWRLRLTPTVDCAPPRRGASATPARARSSTRCARVAVLGVEALIIDLVPTGALGRTRLHQVDELRPPRLTPALGWRMKELVSPTSSDRPRRGAGRRSIMSDRDFRPRAASRSPLHSSLPFSSKRVVRAAGSSGEYRSDLHGVERARAWRARPPCSGQGPRARRARRTAMWRARPRARPARAHALFVQNSMHATVHDLLLASL